jgi:DNA polymerase III subunit gamma/tau
MNQALYRKYRSKSFAEVVGQEHVTKTLEQAIKTGRISHAYLFTGPRGVGKTSVARILAHEVNQLAYQGESIHLDIIEIDAASNRRIDEIRELRERVRIAPTSAKYKVYIIDEVHMLTREAFNALLKTLEEPPAHCIFILATTEAHKLPETIISRTQRFEFKPIEASHAVKHLRNIAKKEQIDISPEALELLAEFGSGSFRDSISYLDQLSSSKSVSDNDVRRILGLPSQREVLALIRSVLDGDAKGLINSIQAIKEQGVSAPELAVAASKQLRQRLIDGEGGVLESQLLKELIEVKASSRPYDYLEVILLESTVKKSPSVTKDDDHGSKVAVKEPSAQIKTAAITPPVAETMAVVAPRFSLEMWDDVVARAKDQAASIYTALRLARPRLSENGTLILAFQFPLHKNKLEQSKNKTLVANLIEDLCGDRVSIECIVDKSLGVVPQELKVSELPQPTGLHSITNIFGAAEMLES